MKVKRKIIEIDEERCDGCGNCVLSCAEGAIQIIDGKAKVIKDSFCDGLGACMGDCPQDALKLIEREADEFDEEAVEAHLKAQAEKSAAPSGETLACGTGAVAGALIAGLLDQAASPVEMTTSGGDRLTIVFDMKKDGLVENVFLKGPAHIVYKGELNAEALL